MADEIIRLDYSAEDIGDNIDEVRTARGTFDTLDDRLDNIEGGGPSPSNPIASNCVSPMTGYSKSSSSTPGNISTDDTLNAAIGKLEKRTELNENNISSLSYGTEISANSDLNDLTTIGEYYSSTTYATATLSNLPSIAKTTNGHLSVKGLNVGNSTRLTQIWYCNFGGTSTGGVVLIRQLVADNQWSAWYQFTGTAVT